MQYTSALFAPTSVSVCDGSLGRDIDMDGLREFFSINRTIVLFVYGLVFFVLGLAIFLQSRRHSRLRLARDLRWLAAFGISHGLYEWGAIFIPIQAAYVSPVIVDLLQTLQVILLAASFYMLLILGVFTLNDRYPWLRDVVLVAGVLWGVGFFFSATQTADIRQWHHLSNIWARYLLAFPGSLLAAYGLWVQVRSSILPLGIGNIARTMYIASGALVSYAVLAGLIVPAGDFFPANVLNTERVQGLIGIPVQVLRSGVGLVLAAAVIRALEIFEIEVDRLIEQMEVDRIQAAERERIGQEIHDGAVQGVYSASLILESIGPLIQPGSEAARRIDQVRSVLSAVTTDLRSYMVSLRTAAPPDPLIQSLGQIATDPRFVGMLSITLTHDCEPTFKPIQNHHILSIVHESLSNTLKHARARHVEIGVHRVNGAVQVYLKDNGRGFNMDTAPMGYGLRSMRDRARLIGGQLDIESAPDSGTTVMLTLPEEKSS